jgi:hypothetical protein
VLGTELSVVARSVPEVGIVPAGPRSEPPEGAVMLIDCDTCTVRGLACGDCVVTVLIGAPPTVAGDGVDLDGAEQAAIAVLADSGLVPPLRLLPDDAEPVLGSVAGPVSVPTDAGPSGDRSEQPPDGERTAAQDTHRASPNVRSSRSRRAAG